MHDPKDTKVALLQGGTSSEREISLKSGQGALEALVTAGYNVECFDPANRTDLTQLLDGRFDVAFICLHGEGGEDGRIQGFLETIGLPYTCSDVASSSICMDKATTKKFYSSAQIPTPASIEIHRPMAINDATIADMTAQIAREIGGHCVIKAPTGGSSIGVYIANGGEDIASALAAGFREDDMLLVEQYVSGREVTVVVLDRILQEQTHAESSATPNAQSQTVQPTSNSKEFPIKETQALPIIEIIPVNDSYDYDSKYLPGGSKHICPAHLSPDEKEKIQNLAVLAHKTLGCSGVSRTDFILDSNGNPWALETNTVPGMTQTSLLPDAARAAGISFPDLCVQLIENALIR